MTDQRKAQIVAGLYTWIHQRPGLEFGNYGDVRTYRAEVRRIGRQLQDARTLLRTVELTESITADDILKATRDYSGRLKIKETVRQYSAKDCPGKPCGDCCDHKGGSTFAIDYCTGQYWPTEYRAAACAVLAAALWDWKRGKAMPEPVKVPACCQDQTNTDETYDGLSAGDWLRRSFRREFGRRIGATWFD